VVGVKRTYTMLVNGNIYVNVLEKLVELHSISQNFSTTQVRQSSNFLKLAPQLT
jgi:hypothetical protein